MKDFRFIFLRLSCYLISGILTAFYFSVNRKILLISGVLLFVLFLISYRRAKKKIFPDSFFGISSFLLIFYLGYSAAYFSIPENQTEHFINQNIDLDQNTLLVASVSEELKPTNFSRRFILDTERLIARKKIFQTHGKLLLNLKNDSVSTSFLKPGMQVLVPWHPEEIKAPLNPFQFSYRNYMHGLQVERQINTYINTVEIRKK